jgi:hypothetical protein
MKVLEMGFILKGKGFGWIGLGSSGKIGDFWIYKKGRAVDSGGGNSKSDFLQKRDEKEVSTVVQSGQHVANKIGHKNFVNL